MFKPEHKDVVRAMVLKNAGWKVTDKLLRDRLKLLISQLVNENDEEKRGRIKELEQFLRNIDKYSQK